MAELYRLTVVDIQTVERRVRNNHNKHNNRLERGLSWKRAIPGIGGMDVQFQCRLFRLVQELTFGVRVGFWERFFALCVLCLVELVGSSLVMLGHIGWEKCGHGLTSRPRETASEVFRRSAFQLQKLQVQPKKPNHTKKQSSKNHQNSWRSKPLRVASHVVISVGLWISSKNNKNWGQESSNPKKKTFTSLPKPLENQTHHKNTNHATTRTHQRKRRKKQHIPQKKKDNNNNTHQRRRTTTATHTKEEREQKQHILPIRMRKTHNNTHLHTKEEECEQEHTPTRTWTHSNHFSQGRRIRTTHTHANEK